MIEHEINPFQELYVTDSPDPNVFVHLFSDVPVRHSQFLFREGNVVLKGTQGSGKSMLLNLFRPSIRLAYTRANAEFPIPREFRRFIGAGINLTRSGAYDIGQRPILEGVEEETAIFPLYFADFVNYFVVRDILESLSIMYEHRQSFDGVVRGENLDTFAAALAEDDCWFDWLGSCAGFEQLTKQLDCRIQGYRRFHNYNADLSPSIRETKTSIGEPIARTAEWLRQTGVIDADVPVFVRIDEVHRLFRSDAIRGEVGTQYRRIVNKALGARDSRISYRVGTRPYAWEDDLRIFGTNDNLEDKRDFQIIDLDDMLQRKEDTKTWIFPSFAEDAFSRRLLHSGFDAPSAMDPIRNVFGEGVSPEESAAEYAGKSSALKVLRITPEWSPAWKEFLLELYGRDPLQAMLATAWARQGGTSVDKRDRKQLPPPTEDFPWQRTYWRKERVRQCLSQIAARNAQRLKWSGKEQILALSSGNISIFLSICYEVWEAHLRSERRKPRNQKCDPVRGSKSIHPDVQAMGIQSASDAWYEKISELPRGDDRQALVDVLGRLFRSWILDDLAMSYPGHNGFSITNEDLQSYSGLRRFLREAVNFGALVEVSHTTKERNRKKRTKWYLSPILSPHFQIPESHVKEPKYIRDVCEVGAWLKKAAIVDGDLQELILKSPISIPLVEGRSVPLRQMTFELDFDAGD